MVRLEQKSSSTTLTKIQRALISVSDKADIIEFAQALNDLGVFIVATGGTARLLSDAGISITEVSDITHFPEMMGGRVKTLHPAIHGGLLGRRGTDDSVMQEHNIPQIDLLICNLYPFEQTIARADCSFEQAIENIDIGGPAMLRSAAKNHQDVTVITDPADYALVLEQLKQSGDTTAKLRKKLAGKVFQKLATYNQNIANYLSQQTEDSIEDSDFAPQWQAHLNKQADLRYGENPHQAAALYAFDNAAAGSLAKSELIQGKPLSFNNLMDTEAALRCVSTLESTQAACVIVKHATPCGVAQADNQHDAYQRAFACDCQSAFGGIIAFNQPIDAITMAAILKQQFVEVIIAPSVSNEAAALASKKPNMRVLCYGDKASTTDFTYHSISGGLLIQSADNLSIEANELTVVTQRKPTQQQIIDCLFAWRIVQFVKSNAIVYAKDGQTLGIGTGQTSRVFAAQIAALKANQAGLNLSGSVMASDAFFPFADGIQVGIDAGIEAIIQPGGSMRDQEVIDAADAAGIVMLTTGQRHFRH